MLGPCGRASGPTRHSKYLFGLEVAKSASQTRACLNRETVWTERVYRGTSLIRHSFLP